MTTTVLNTKISEVENKITDHTKYIITQEFNKLTAENFAERSKQANLVSKTNFHDNLISFNRKITSNKTKYLEVQKKLNSLPIKDYNFFLDIIYFKSNNGSQNTFVYEPTLDTLELKKDKVADYFLSSKYLLEVYNSKPKPLYTAFLQNIKHFGYKME